MPGSRCSPVSPPTARAQVPAQHVVLIALALILALAAVLVLPSASYAERPFRLLSQVDDHAGVLGEQEAAVVAAIEALQAAERVQLWVTYVDTFSGMGAQQWADETATKSDLGLNDVLLAVAVKDRAYAYSVDQEFPLTEEQMNAVMTQKVEPALQQDKWAAAAVSAATGMLQELNSTPTSTFTGIPDVADSVTKTVATVTWVIGLVVLVFVIVVLAVIGAFIFAVTRRRRSQGAGGKAAADEPPPVPLDELRRQANAALVETDDAVKTSTEELGFAVAEFGDEQAAPFKQALDQAQLELDQAFKLQKELDDAQGEAAQRELLTGILTHTQAANAGLDAEVDRFDRLRDLERTAPDVLARLEAQAAELEKRRPEIERVLAEMTGVYAPAAVAPVAAAPADAAARLEFARQQIAAGREDLAAGRKGEAAVDAVAAEAATGQAQELLDSVERLRQDLSGAQTLIDAAIAETRRDIAEAQAAGGPQLQPLVATADAAVRAAADAAGPAGGRDPLGALRRLKDADDALEQALQQVRDAQARRAKAKDSYDRTLGAARSQLASADDFIRTHRGGVDAAPRTTLAEARRELKAAETLGDTDPEAAATHAARAQELAGDAFDSARLQAGQGQGPGMPGGAVMTGMVIGGILAGALAGGRGPGGGARGGGGFAPPSFGGGGTRMRRGGGGRF